MVLEFILDAVPFILLLERDRGGHRAEVGDKGVHQRISQWFMYGPRTDEWDRTILGLVQVQEEDSSVSHYGHCGYDATIR